MSIIHNYSIPLVNLNLKKIISSWAWLIGDNKNIIALTKVGDAFFTDPNKNLYFLDVGEGAFQLISNDYNDLFNGKLDSEVVEEFLLPTVVDNLEENGIILKDGQVYSYVMLPILGGKYDEKNMYAVDIYEHYDLASEIHLQIKDLPDGSTVSFKVIP